MASRVRLVGWLVATFVATAVALVLLLVFGAQRASAAPGVTVLGSSVPVSCPIPVSSCTYDDVSSMLSSDLGTSGVTWTMQMPGLPADGLSVGAARLAVDSGNLSLAMSGTMTLPAGGQVPVQLDALWTSPAATTPQVVMAVQPVNGALSALNPAWSNAVDPSLRNMVLATGPASGTLTVASLPSAAQAFYDGATTMAVGPGLSLYAGLDTSSDGPALAHALSYLGLGSTITVSGTLSDNLDPLVDPTHGNSAIDLTIGTSGTGSLPSWVTSRTASLEFSDPQGGPVVTLRDALTTSIAGHDNSFTGTATVDASSFANASVDVRYEVNGGFDAPFGLSRLSLSATTLDLKLTTGSAPSFSGELDSTVAIGNDQLQLTTTLSVAQDTVSGSFALSNPTGVSVDDAVTLANTLLGTSAALPSGSVGSGLSLTGVTFSFSTTSGERQFALLGQGTLGTASGDVLVALDDTSGTAKLFAGLHLTNVDLGTLVSGTSDGAATQGLSFPSLDLFASSGYLDNGQPTSVDWTNLLPAEQAFFNDVYAGQPPTSVSFGPTLSVQGQLTLPAGVTDTFGLSGPIVFSGDLGFGLDSVGASTPPRLGGSLTAQLPALTSGLPSWLASTAPATLTLAADSSGNISLSLSASATATIQGTAHDVQLTGSFAHTGTSTTVTITSSLTGTFGNLFGASWLSLDSPAVALTITHDEPAGGQPSTTLSAALTGNVTIDGYTLSAQLQLSDGTSGATATVKLDSAPNQSPFDLSALVTSLWSTASPPSSLPTVSLTDLHIQGSASRGAGETLDATASTSVSLPGSAQPLDSTLLFHLVAGTGKATSVVAGFALDNQPKLSDILPAGDPLPNGTDFTLPHVALLVADPATTLTWADLTPSEQHFLQPFCGDDASACHTSLDVPSGVTLVGAFPMPASLSDAVAALGGTGSSPTSNILVDGTIPVFGSSALDLKVDLPEITPPSSAPDFFDHGQLSFEIALKNNAPALSLDGTATFNIPKGSVAEAACTIASDGGVWRTPRGGTSAACYDQVPFSLVASVQLAPLDLTLTGGLSSGYTWRQPLGATWLDLDQAAIQLGISPSGASLGFLIGATIDGHDFSGAIAASVTVGPTGLDPNLVGFRLASGSGLSMQDLVSFGNLVAGTNIQLDSAKIPNLAVRNILLSYSQTDDPQLCLPLGVHIAGDLYLNPGSDVTTVSPSADCGGDQAPNRTAICQQDSSKGCLAAADIDVNSSGITASGLIGGFNVGPLTFDGAEVDLALTPTNQHLVIAGGLSVPDFLTGSADLLITPSQLEFRGSASLFGSGLQAYLDGSASLNVTSLSDIENVGSFNVTAVLQTTFLHQAQVAIAAPLQKLQPLLQIVNTMIIDLDQGKVLSALTTLPTQLAHLGDSLPDPYGQVFQKISDGLSAINSALSQADEAGSATLDALLNGTTINFAGIPGTDIPASCITTRVDGTCYFTPPVSTIFGTIPGTPGIETPESCLFVKQGNDCWSVPPFSITIPGICSDLSSLIPGGLNCSSNGIFDDIISPVLRSVIKSATGYDMGKLDLRTFLTDVDQGLTSGDLFNLSCAEFQASAQIGTTPSASVSLAATGSVLSYPFNQGLSWNFAPDSTDVTSDVQALLSNLVNPTTSTGTCGLPANWNDNPDFPGISGSVTAPPGVGSSGGSGTANQPTPPSLSVSLGSATIIEGSSATLSGSITPAPTSPEQVTVNWGDGSAPGQVMTGSDGSFSATHPFPDIAETGPSAQYLITASASGSLRANATLTVNDAIPSGLTVNGPTAAVPTGSPISLSGAFTDPATEPHTVTADWGDGTSSSVNVPAGTTAYSGLGHTYVDELENGDPYIVSVTVSDDNRAVSTSTTLPVTVVDAPPNSISVVPLDSSGQPCPTCAMTVPEQQMASFHVGFAYASSAADPVTATVDWGDGTTPLTVSLPRGTLSFDVTHVWTEADTASHPDGQFPIRVTLTDEDGGVGTTAPVETVTNVAPSNLSACLPLTSSAPAGTACPVTATEPEGTNVTLFGGFTDPSALDTHTVTIDWGPGWPQATRVQTIQLGVGAFGYDASRTFGDEGTYPIKVTVTDDDGAAVTTTDTLTVTNVAPSAAILPAGQTTVQGVPAYLTRAGTTIGLNASASDPGNDPLSLTWAFGDGATNQTVIPSGSTFTDGPDPEDPTYAPVSGTDPVTHAWTTPCLYTVGFSATDPDGATADSSTDAVVTGTNPMAWQAGYWHNQFSGQLSPALACDLKIVDRMSAVFGGPGSVTPTAPVSMASTSDALGVLQPSSSSARAKLEREILTMWLDYADGAFTFDEIVHPSGSPAGYTPAFSSLMSSAETAALDPNSTSRQLQQLTAYLDGLIGS